ncbi:MAG: NADH-quinone oxidoreductase subunit C [Opitutales bacterium]|nr:NADH-quinone oxidoreductase subunit C [Opitutales bacterium]
MSTFIEELEMRLQERFPPMETEQTRVEAKNDEAEDSADDATDAPAPSAAPCERMEFSKVGINLKLSVKPTQVIEAARLMDEYGFAIDMITGVDWPEDSQLELIYDFLHFESYTRVAVHTRIPRDDAKIESLTAVYPGANWHERETAEFFGIDFINHPNLINLLLPEDMVGYPLRKDFKPEPSPY